jgi:serine/threonine protein kinase
MLEIDENMLVALRWCEAKGQGWSLGQQLGLGGTAPVFEIETPIGTRALKVYDARFTTDVERRRLAEQLSLKGHDCPSLVQIFEGGEFEGRLFVVMARAPGKELEKCLPNVPRNMIRHIVDQVARAALYLSGRDLCHRDIKAANVFVSEDFQQVTLLDISVIRDIEDPVGAGTDHDDQLPVVATARYSPPEYLFRLLAPGPELWHALNIYQLGALLHDLIMREPLFQSEYAKSAENRYRFAWIVATTAPRILAEDLDQDLIFTARRALDKDWELRSLLRLEDFLADSSIQKAHALQFVGLSKEPAALPSSDDAGSRLERIRETVKVLDQIISDRLRRKGATTQHAIRHGADDHSKLLTFRWNAPPAEANTNSGPIELQISLSLNAGWRRSWFRSSAQMRAVVDGEQRQSTMALPDIEDEPGAESEIANQVELALADLAVMLTRPKIAL